MSVTSKSPRKVLQVAYAVAKDALPTYAHRCSPRKFTQHQLFACLVLKAFWKTDYRGIVAMLSDLPELCAVIDLNVVPHFTTLQKAERRLLLSKGAEALISATLRMATDAGMMRSRVAIAAIDGTGFESHHVSAYFIRRRERGGNRWQTTTYKRYPKAGIVCDCRTHMILTVVPGRGPGSDIQHYARALRASVRRVRIDTLLADAGYDSENSHVFARRTCQVRTIIPAKIGRPSAKPPSGYWRRRMARRLNKKKYGQRWQVETVNSMIKRSLGSALRARNYWTQCREMTLRAIAINVMVLQRRIKGFLQSRTGSFSAGRPASGCLTGALTDPDVRDWRIRRVESWGCCGSA